MLLYAFLTTQKVHVNINAKMGAICYKLETIEYIQHQMDMKRNYKYSDVMSRQLLICIILRQYEICGSNSIHY